MMVNFFRVIYFQDVLDFSPTFSGEILFSSMLPYFFLLPVIGYYAERVSWVLFTSIGYFLLIGSLLLLAFFSTPTIPLIIISLSAFSVGSALIFSPSYAIAINIIPKEKRGAGFGIISTLNTFFALLGLALIGLLLHVAKSFQLEKNASSIDAVRMADIFGFSTTHFVLAGLACFFLLVTMLFRYTRST